MPRPIAILGAGNIATALAVILAKRRPIRLYAVEGEVAEEINRRHRNSKYLKGVSLPKNIRAEANIALALKGADTVILAVPSQAVPEVMTLAAPFFERDAVLGCITKGFNPETLLPTVRTAACYLPQRLKKKICAIGGPAVAMELAIRKPAGLLVAGQDKRSVKFLAKLIENDNLKVATSDDLLGVGYAMAFKNIYAIALGLCDGLGYPMNTKALVMTLGLQEIAGVLRAVGARPETEYSLAGLGDILTTGLSVHGRNRSYGERLVNSRTKDPRRLGLQTVEGIAAAGYGQKLARSLRVKTPLLDAIAKCLKSSSRFERPFVNFLTDLRLS
jgi:glycerol-3-phosphate dehydrogenase (NAD(P)+)